LQDGNSGGFFTASIDQKHLSGNGSGLEAPWRAIPRISEDERILASKGEAKGNPEVNLTARRLRKVRKHRGN